jgi:hypothetical protein
MTTAGQMLLAEMLRHCGKYFSTIAGNKPVLPVFNRDLPAQLPQGKDQERGGVFGGSQIDPVFHALHAQGCVL